MKRYKCCYQIDSLVSLWFLLKDRGIITLWVNITKRIIKYLAIERLIIYVVFGCYVNITFTQELLKYKSYVLYKFIFY